MVAPMWIVMRYEGHPSEQAVTVATSMALRRSVKWCIITADLFAFYPFKHEHKKAGLN